MIVVLLSLFLAVVSTWAAVVTWKWIELGKIVLAIEERLEEAVDTLDMHEKQIGSVLEVPLASDDPLVKKVVADIRAAQLAIIKISSTLTDDFDNEVLEDVVPDNETNE